MNIKNELANDIMYISKKGIEGIYFLTLLNLCKSSGFDPRLRFSIVRNSFNTFPLNDRGLVSNKLIKYR